MFWLRTPWELPALQDACVCVEMFLCISKCVCVWMYSMCLHKSVYAFLHVCLSSSECV